MKPSVYICLSILVISAIFGGVYAFSGFNLLRLLCLGSETVYRSYLAVNLAAALFTLYALFSGVLRSVLSQRRF